MSIDNNKYCIKQMSRPTQCVQLNVSNCEMANLPFPNSLKHFNTASNVIKSCLICLYICATFSSLFFCIFFRIFRRIFFFNILRCLCNSRTSAIFKCNSSTFCINCERCCFLRRISCISMAHKLIVSPSNKQIAEQINRVLCCTESMTFAFTLLCVFRVQIFPLARSVSLELPNNLCPNLLVYRRGEGWGGSNKINNPPRGVIQFFAILGTTGSSPSMETL